MYCNTENCENVNQQGTHGLSCNRNTGRHSRHSEANDVIARSFSSAGIPSIREPRGIIRRDGKHPDGLSLIPWYQERQLLWDFSCSDTLAESYLPHTSINAGAAASISERKKGEYTLKQSTNTTSSQSAVKP